MLVVEVNSAQYSDLPFVAGNTNDGWVFWNVEHTENIEQEIKKGQEYAISLVNYMQENRDTLLLRAVVAAIVKSGVYRQLELAFFTKIGVLIAR